MQVIIKQVHSDRSCQWSEAFQKKVNVIHEDIHWMFLIAGIKLV